MTHGQAGNTSTSIALDLENPATDATCNLIAYSIQL